METSKFAGISETETAEGTEKKKTFVREVTARYRGPRRVVSQIRNPEDAGRFMRSILPDNVREHFIALYLDGAHAVCAYSIVSTGTANSCQVHPREVFQTAILAGAVSTLVGHNHPSGRLEPSDEDKKVTEILKEAGNVLGIKLLDHVIIGRDAVYSICSEVGRGN